MRSHVQRLRSIWMGVCLFLLAGFDGMAFAEQATLVDPIRTEEVVAEMHEYFGKELRGGLVLVGMGAPSVALGGGMLAQDRPLWRGFAFPTLIIGALELGGGILFAARTPKQVRVLDQGFAQNPQLTRDRELRRMRRVNTQFSLIEILEVSLHLGGIGMAAVGGGIRNETLTGVGLGLSVQSMGLLLFDIFAARRALRFTNSLERMGR